MSQSRNTEKSSATTVPDCQHEREERLHRPQLRDAVGEEVDDFDRAQREQGDDGECVHGATS